MSKEVNNEENARIRSLLDETKEIARKYGARVIDGAGHGIRAIGILGGITEKFNKKLRGVWT